ncbi:MAG: hypothetical protein GKR90_14695 [Pseudomonadales bacterium]|nr:hypothetical protein [Pseudomonadales bacterium]
MANYQVLFNGELVESASFDAVRDNLARELGLDDRKAKQLFSGRTVVIRSQLEQTEAQAWQERFAELGAICRIKNLAPAEQPLGIRDGLEANSEPDRTLRDITAAHLECPRCGYMQLDASHCARCGVDLEEAARVKRNEDLMIEKKLRALREERERRSNQTLPPLQEEERSLPRAGVYDIRESKSKPKKGMLSWLKRT